MYHKYEGMTDMLTGTMMEELANIITCVTGDARHRRTIYEADQDFERFGKTLIANFKDTADPGPDQGDRTGGYLSTLHL
jgi:hypothetical protein